MADIRAFACNVIVVLRLLHGVLLVTLLGVC